MKKTLAFIVLVALIVNCVSTPRYYIDYTRSEQIVISERVGDTIDPDEQERFDLFSGIEDFKTATFYGIEGGGYEVEILTTNKKLVAVNRDPKGIEILRNYIDSYAEMQYSKEDFEKKWEIVAYDALVFPITKSEVNRYSNPATSSGCGCGTAVLITGLSSLVAIGIAMSNFNIFNGGRRPEDERAANIVLACGIVCGIIAGILVHSKKRASNMKTALEFIKEARKPRVVD